MSAPTPPTPPHIAPYLKKSFWRGITSRTPGFLRSHASHTDSQGRVKHSQGSARIYQSGGSGIVEVKVEAEDTQTSFTCRSSVLCLSLRSESTTTTGPSVMNMDADDLKTQIDFVTTESTLSLRSSSSSSPPNRKVALEIETGDAIAGGGGVLIGTSMV
ncbi:hypothetical protein M422DRAFT_259975 [Sphaerobolus stellatus SS14]|uniref:Uncharacterized protein n=1 Tax=Sphaerobolus stellatus (strain SS14) TaxID=990650 RepID=A0A0C9VJM8_SPHS4|nr:hypothetical protein M422DRAFT_259975 [Sphaerobolus stellatus SS14]